MIDKTNIIKTKTYLKNYYRYKIALTNLNDELNELNKKKQEEITPPPQALDNIRSTKQELTPVEAIAAKLEVYDDRIKEIHSQIKNLTRIIVKVDRALNGLNNTDKHIIIDRYFERKSWRDIGQKYYFSSQWAMAKGNKAVKQLSEMIFGFNLSSLF